MTTGNRRLKFISWLCKLTRLNCGNKWSIIFTEKHLFWGLNFSFSQESTSRKYFSLADWADSRENNSRSMDLWCEASRKHSTSFFLLDNPLSIWWLERKLPITEALPVYLCLSPNSDQSNSYCSSHFFARFNPADTIWSGYIKALIPVITFVLVLSAFKIPSMQMSTK